MLDCAFSVVEAGGRQHCFYGSRLAPLERTEMQVGPFRLEVVEPLRRARVVLDDNDTGLACDLTFTARTAPIQEARQVLWDGTRRVMDATRFAQFGSWTGSRPPRRHARRRRLVRDEGPLVGYPRCRRARPARRTAGRRRSAFFLWAPLFWDDHVSHAVFFDGPDGEPLVREGLAAPLFADGDDDPAGDHGHRDPDARPPSTGSGTTPAPGSPPTAELDLIDLDGRVRTITFEPRLRFQMKGLGYGHPPGRRVRWQGELTVAGESFDPDELDLLRPENIHVQQVCRVHDGERTGIGALEQLVIGPYAPAGFTATTDGATPAPDT